MPLACTSEGPFYGGVCIAIPVLGIQEQAHNLALFYIIITKVNWLEMWFSFTVIIDSRNLQVAQFPVSFSVVE